jgi:hypothetical protein
MVPPHPSHPGQPPGDNQLDLADQNSSVRPTEYSRSRGPVSAHLQLFHPGLLPHVWGGDPLGERCLRLRPSLTSSLVEEGRILSP